ncbi:MAG: CapA family protein [Prevotellaceae bacterium]|jgi:hypothetical protein|nr:CapA family protein [Prevotellaceae bacterium]
MKKYFFVTIFVLSFLQSFAQQNDTIKLDTITVENIDTVEIVDTVQISHLLDTIKIAAVGDIQMGTAYPNGEFLPSFDPVMLFKNVLPFFNGSDIVFGNLEGALTDNLSQVKSCSNPTLCYFFGMPTKYAASLKNAGFNLLSIANNHLGDFGDIGRKSTQKALKDNGLHFAGLTDCAVDTFTVNNVRYGFCAFAPNTGTIDVRKIDEAQKIVQELKTVSDIVIVSFHAGGEGKDFQHVTRKTEICFGENRGNVYQFAHSMIDAGADVLLGHGPHVTRGIEVYKNRFIAYSMGNFCTYARVSISGVNGLAPLFQIYTQKDGTFLKAQIIPTSQLRREPVQYDTQNRVIEVIKNLTFNDFPEMKSVIEISNEGEIKLKK